MVGYPTFGTRLTSIFSTRMGGNPIMFNTKVSPSTSLRQTRLIFIFRRFKHTVKWRAKRLLKGSNLKTAKKYKSFNN
jgi:hypothetical protein